MRRLGRVLAVLGLLVAITRVAAAGGELDASFGTTGFVTIDSGPWGDRFVTHGAARSLDPANPDAVVLVAVAPTSGGLGIYSAAVAPTGTVLGSSGLGLGSTTDFGVFTRVLADPTDPSHRLYVAGYRYLEGATPPISFFVGRLTALGEDLDPAWGGGAPVVTAIPGTTQSRVDALAVQPDGKLLVAGGANADFADIAVARYDTSGTLDPAFGPGGTVVIPGGIVRAIAVQGDGKILLAGYFDEGPFGGFGIMRLLADGSLDATFGAASGAPGVVTTGFTARYTQGIAVGVQELADGRIIAAGSDWDPRRLRGSFVAARYLSDGALDPTFARGRGRIRKRVGKSNAAGAIAFLADGKTLIAGSARRRHPEYHSDIALLRLNADGKPDRSFGHGGKVQTPAVPDWEGFGVRDVVVDSVGRTTVVGVRSDGTAKASILARYLP